MLLEQGIGPLRLLFHKAESLHQSNNYIKTFLSVPVSNICISRAQCGDPGCGVQGFACKLIRFPEEPVLCSLGLQKHKPPFRRERSLSPALSTPVHRAPFFLLPSECVHFSGPHINLK